jgi:DNA-binding NarL/FixJ family response regulator
VTKSIAAEDLAEAVVRVAEGDAFFSPRLAGFVLDAFGASQAHTAADPGDSSGHLGPTSNLDQLSAREREVMRFLARGYSYKEIAAQLHISVKTVETHASAVLRKLQMSSRHQLTHWAAHNKVV